MIIIKMQGGLGNQMFQYALYQSLRARNREVKMDDVSGFVGDEQRRPILEETFGVTYEKATPQEVDDIRDAHLDLLNRIRRKLTGRKSLEYFEPQDGNFDPAVFGLEDAYLTGYWQSERYFSDRDVRRRVEEDFRVDPARVFRESSAWEKLKQIHQTESVSIHIRRGDYLWPGTVETFGNICTEEYYKRAVEYILERYPDAMFYVFSNDKEWTATHLGGSRFVTVEFDEMLSDTADLFLMSSCKHHILANSSFSWWAAWLNDTPNKLVVAPAKWLNNKDMQDIYTDRMVRIE